MKRTSEGILQEAPLSICPACGQAVYESEDEDVVWTCPCDLHPDHVMYRSSNVTEAMKEESGDYSNCPSAHNVDGSYCELCLHLPLHSACYNSDTVRY